jgi:tetratricopeptide (TPR) repeat protein
MKFNFKHKIIFSFLFFIGMNNYSQKKDKDLPKANEDFVANNYSEAEANYRISQSKFPEKATSSYNLGNAIYTQKQPSESKLAFAKAIEKAKTYTEKYKAYHNLGNAYMKEKEYEQAEQAYKNALINNPEDEETRYNYALAKKKNKENPKKPDDKKKDKDKKEDDKKDKDKPKDDNGEKPKPEPSPESKQQLENMLNALNNEEKKVQEKMNKNKQKGTPVKPEKDW